MKVTLIGQPISVNAMYRGRRFLTKEGERCKTLYKMQARHQYKGSVAEGPVIVTVRAYLMNPKRSDLDNILKGTLDSLTGVLWKDDRQIQELHVFKLEDKKNPRVELAIEATEKSAPFGAPSQLLLQ